MRLPHLFRVVSFCALAALPAACQRARPARDYNLLLVTVDTIRADRVGAYGHTRAETPILDRLAREGVRFDVARSAVPLTLPSHATLLTGLLPLHHGVRNNGSGRLPDKVETLATWLQKAGYRTAAFVGAFVLDRRFGLSRGFDHYDDEIERDEAEGARLEAERRADVVVDRAVRWLDSFSASDEHPFFVWVHLYDPHAPYEAPEPYATRHPGAPYDAEIAYVDAEIGRLLATLDRSGLADRTVVALAGDHGESLGEHGELTHGVFIYESSLRVPLILKAPRLLPGRSIRTPVSLVDVAPTLAGLLQRPLPGQPRLDGRDLSLVLQQGREPAEDDLYAESQYPRAFGWSDLAMLSRGPLKYIEAPRAELYDLARDRGEASSLGTSDPRAASLKRRLDAIVKTTRQGARSDLLGSEGRERLASLGYLGGASEIPPPASARDPKDTIALFRAFEEANWALQDNRIAEATDILERLVVEDEANPVFVGLLAQASRRQGQFDRAVALYRRALTAAPDDVDVRYNLAVTLHEAGRASDALLEAEEAIRRDPGRPEAHNALGIALFAAGKHAETLAEFERSLALDPRSALAENNRGNVLRAAGRLDEAAAAYRRAVELAPRYVDPLNGIGSVEVQRGRPRDGLPYFERALALAPDRLEVRLNRAIALDELGDLTAALAEYRAFLTASSNRVEFGPQRKIAAALIARIQEASTEATPSKATADKELVKRGEAVFTRHCQICHLGRPNKTNPFIGRNLRGLLKNAKPEQEAAVREAIKKGSDHMPAYEYTLTPAQIDDLMGYLKGYN